MRISDWSSDVCSSDLAELSAHPQLRRVTVQTPTGPVELVAPPVEIRGCAFDLGAVPAVDQHGADLRIEVAARAKRRRKTGLGGSGAESSHEMPSPTRTDCRTTVQETECQYATY